MSAPKDDLPPPHPLEEGALHPFTPGEEVVWRPPGSQDPLIGQRIGEFLVRRRLGAGGMSVVYLGEHTLIGRKVAIKLLRPQARGGGRPSDMETEARALGAIRHRGIVDVFGFGTLPEFGQYMIMEYLEGQSLEELLQQQGALRPAYALKLISEVLGALSAAHGVGVIHRDLKPGNLFVVREPDGAERVKVLDFGVAKQAALPHGAAPQTLGEFVIGTAEYMAPEQACGQPVSPRTDLYAVGVILFELLTGQLPFAGDLTRVAFHHVNTPPPAPSTLVRGLSPQLEELVLRLLAKKPEERPDSAAQVLEELEAMRRPSPAQSALARREVREIPALHSSQNKLKSRWYTQPQWQMALGAACALAAILLGILIASLIKHSPTGTAPLVPPQRAPIWNAPRPRNQLMGSSNAYQGQRSSSEGRHPEHVTPGANDSQSSSEAEGALKVLSTCSSSIYVDGVFRVQASEEPLDLPSGTHMLTLTSPHTEVFRAPVMIRPGVQTVLSAPCTPSGE